MRLAFAAVIVTLPLHGFAAGTADARCEALVRLVGHGLQQKLIVPEDLAREENPFTTTAPDSENMASRRAFTRTYAEMSVAERARLRTKISNLLEQRGRTEGHLREAATDTRHVLIPGPAETLGQQHRSANNMYIAGTLNGRPVFETKMKLEDQSEVETLFDPFNPSPEDRIVALTAPAAPKGEGGMQFFLQQGQNTFLVRPSESLLLNLKTRLDAQPGPISKGVFENLRPLGRLEAVNRHGGTKIIAQKFGKISEQVEVQIFSARGFWSRPKVLDRVASFSSAPRLDWVDGIPILGVVDAKPWGRRVTFFNLDTNKQFPTTPLAEARFNSNCMQAKAYVDRGKWRAVFDTPALTGGSVLSIIDVTNGGVLDDIVVPVQNAREIHVLQTAAGPYVYFLADEILVLVDLRSRAWTTYPAPKNSGAVGQVRYENEDYLVWDTLDGRVTIFDVRGERLTESKAYVQAPNGFYWSFVFTYLERPYLFGEPKGGGPPVLVSLSSE